MTYLVFSMHWHLYFKTFFFPRVDSILCININLACITVLHFNLHANKQMILMLFILQYELSAWNGQYNMEEKICPFGENALLLLKGSIRYSCQVLILANTMVPFHRKQVCCFSFTCACDYTYFVKVITEELLHKESYSQVQLYQNWQQCDPQRELSRDKEE